MRTEGLKLWYKEPANSWNEALPIGNGRLGAMVFGGVKEERIQLNEESIWAGPPVPEDREGAWKYIEQGRKLYFEGKYEECDRLIQENVISERISPRSYQPLGDLNIYLDGMDKVVDYRRELNLNTAVATVSYVCKGINYKREVFSSPVDQVLVVRLTASQKAAISATVKLSRAEDAAAYIDEANRIILKGQASHKGKHKGVNFAAVLSSKVDGGEIDVDGDRLRVTCADRVTLYIASATDYNFDDPYNPLKWDIEKVCISQIEMALRKSYSYLKEQHVKEHQRLFGRVELNLGEDNEKLPTNQRLDMLKEGKIDNQLMELYFQFGRYLLISSSRPGCMPSNLQGIWNDLMEAPWNSDYHININIQMNYWLAQATNLEECHLPYFKLLEGIVNNGKNTAKKVYNCRGFAAHNTTDAWFFTAPKGHTQYGMWPMGAGWCVRDFMEYYRFTGDREFLEERAYPIIKEACLFFLDWLVESPKNGKLVSGPTSSPENMFIAPNGEVANLCMGTSMDQQIIFDTFTNLLEAAKELNIEDEFTLEVSKAKDNLFMPQIASDGRLMEWFEEFKEQEIGHRHISHLFGLHPGKQYSWRDTPEFMEAAKKSLEYRLANGGGHTGWSRAWIINFWARLLDAEKAYENLTALLTKSTYYNLFDAHPPFQIDGNFGGTAGITEMLIQSHAGQIDLLPALPKAWKDGHVKGLRARGGFKFDIFWKAGELQKAEIYSLLGKNCTVSYGDKALSFDTQLGEKYTLYIDESKIMSIVAIN